MSNGTTVLREWAQAIREDWGTVDGRSCRSQLQTLADYIDIELSDGVSAPLAQIRDDVGICPSGNAHWSGYCNESHCEDAA